MNQNIQLDINWAELMPAADWDSYGPPLSQAQSEGLRYALHGGLAFSALSGRLRNTKDLDVVVVPEDAPRMIQIIRDHGFEDYYDHAAYDRGWIFRGYRQGLIFDVIWQMANYRAPVDIDWVRRGPVVDVFGQRVQLIAPEEMLWAKLYVMQRGRCDWPDLLSLLYAQGPTMDWIHLLGKIGEEDLGLLAGLISTFGWVCPEIAVQLPAWLWPRLGLRRPKLRRGAQDPVSLFDSREWFGPSRKAS